MEAGAREIVNVCLPSCLGDRWAGDDVCGLACAQKAKQFSPMRYDLCDLCGARWIKWLLLTHPSGLI